MSLDLSSVTNSNYGEGDMMSFHDILSVQDSPKLSGRNSQSMQLLHSFHRVLNDHSFETAIVHGASGTGKTSLVDALREPVVKSNGFLCAGKFFQNSQVQESYSALSSAFSDLCDLIAQSDDFDQDKRERIKEDLKEDGHLLVHVISGLSQFLGDYTVLSKSRMETAFTMFKVACKTFLQAMTSPEHPVVLVLDDIQWIDQESRILIKMLLEDKDLKNLLLILVYRDEEQEKVSDLFEESKQASRIDIGLHNLEVCGVQEMICLNLDLDSNKDNVAELAALVHHRTDGNPFHVAQFLNHILREGLLEVSETNGCIIDVDRTRHETVMSESIVDVLELKVKRLPANVQETLKLASLLGFCFKADVLSSVVLAMRDMLIESSASIESIELSLHEAVKEGFVERTSRVGEYRFLHDKLQSSFRSMISSGTAEQRLHRVIGETFLTRDDTDSIYQAAMHLNLASELLETNDERVKLARINMDAAKYSSNRSAFVTAATLLRDALVLIPGNQQWTTYYDLTLETSQSLASVDLILGRFDECQEVANQVLEKAKCLEDKRETLETIARVHISKNEVDAAKVVTKRALNILGVSMPTKVTTLHVIRKLLRVRRLLRGKSDQELLALPMMTDRVMITAIKVLADQSIGCLIAGDEDQLVYSSLLGVELSLLTMSLSPYTPSALAFYSVSELFVGGFERARRFGQLTLSMLDHIGCESMVGSSARLMVLTNVMHYRQPLAHHYEAMRNSMRFCSEAGDIVFYVYAAASLSWAMIYTGENLASIESELRFMYPRLCDFDQDAMLRWFQPSFQFVLKLRSTPEKWTDVADLSGEVMGEDEYLRHSKECSHDYFTILALIFKLQLAFHFGYVVLAETVMEDLKPIIAMSRSDYNYFTWHFFASLTYYEQFRRTDQRRYLRLARKHKRKLKSERKEFRTCPNSTPLIPLLDAEDLSVSRKKIRNQQGKEALAEAYNAAIKAVAKAGFVNMEALANERAAFVFCKEYDAVRAEKYFSRALELYKDRWGATVKHDWLKEKSGVALALMRRMSYQSTGLVLPNTISVGKKSLDIIEEEAS